MAKAFRPMVIVSVLRSYRGEFEDNVSNGHIQKQFPTYAKVKSKIKELLSISKDDEVRVYRHRRGEWGEWFEVWGMVNGKPKIVKQGWQ